MAHPIFCRYWIPLNTKLLSVSIKKKNVMITFVATRLWDTDFNALFTVFIPSWLGISGWNDFVVTRILSLMYIFCFIDSFDEACGWRKWSTISKFYLYDIWLSLLQVLMVCSVYEFWAKYGIEVYSYFIYGEFSCCRKMYLLLTILFTNFIIVLAFWNFPGTIENFGMLGSETLVFGKKSYLETVH